MTSEALPGRQTGSTEWRRARGELGSSSASLHVQCPKRQCVDHHVSEVFLALGKLCSLGKDKPSILGETLQAVLGILHRVKKVPYRSRQAMLQSVSLAESVGNRQGASNVQQIIQAIGLSMAEGLISQHRSTDSDPIDIALALTVAIENLESLLASANKNDQSASWLEQLAFYSENERLHGSWAEASGEKADGVGVPSGIATAAFDGLCSTKWLEPNGSKGCWLTYFLPDKITSPVHFYELMSANDCPERDPRDWVLEGSSDGGWTWNKLDYRQSQFFSKRFERKRYEVSVDKERLCNAFRLRFLETRDSSSQPRLQLSCVNFYRKKE
ncbi:hypothetical protein KP509_35G041400 [Ceratopteris richardii]|nr:hypothetical protein KP509_35G041400 [Ceratopteris richardii]